MGRRCARESNSHSLRVERDNAPRGPHRVREPASASSSMSPSGLSGDPTVQLPQTFWVDALCSRLGCRIHARDDFGSSMAAITTPGTTYAGHRRPASVTWFGTGEVGPVSNPQMPSRSQTLVSPTLVAHAALHAHHLLRRRPRPTTTRATMAVQSGSVGNCIGIA